MFTRTCGLPECGIEFQTDNKRKMHCSRAHSNLAQVRRWRAKRRKGGGGGGGGGNGGGGEPGLFDSITPVDSRAIYVPDTSYRTPEPERKTPKRISVADDQRAA
jgi:hypothetical protein